MHHSSVVVKSPGVNNIDNSNNYKPLGSIELALKSIKPKSQNFNIN